MIAFNFQREKNLYVARDIALESNPICEVMVWREEKGNDWEEHLVLQLCKLESFDKKAWLNLAQNESVLP